MCMFCAAIPAAAAAGAALNNKQIKTQHEAEAAGRLAPVHAPVLKITGGVMLMLLVGSITYHTLRFGP